MKTTTIYQPYASLIAIGAKRYETRSRKTNYRGPIAIHAGLKNPYTVISNNYTLYTHVKRAFGYELLLGELPLGAVIATAELVECHCIVQHSPSTGRIVTDKGIIVPAGDELLFGDWTPGRYLWELANVQMLPEPIPARGQQGLWNWDERAC